MSPNSHEILCNNLAARLLTIGSVQHDTTTRRGSARVMTVLNVTSLSSQADLGETSGVVSVSRMAAASPTMALKSVTKGSKSTSRTPEMEARIKVLRWFAFKTRHFLTSACARVGIAVARREEKAFSHCSSQGRNLRISVRMERASTDAGSVSRSLRKCVFSLLEHNCSVACA